MAAALPPLASVIPWDQVCRMLEKVSEEKGGPKKKKEMLLKFITHFRELHAKKLQHHPHCQDTFFPVLRVLLPALDRGRGAYGVKERRLADLYIRILGLKKDGNDAQKLINFRKPKASAGGESGDFAEVAYYVLRNRCLNGGKLSLQEVDDHLNSIAENHAAKKHAGVTHWSVTSCGPMDARWPSGWRWSAVVCDLLSPVIDCTRRSVGECSATGPTPVSGHHTTNGPLPVGNHVSAGGIPINIATGWWRRGRPAVERSLLVMLNDMSAKEQKWLLRVLLKDMRLGVGQTGDPPQLAPRRQGLLRRHQQPGEEDLAALGIEEVEAMDRDCWKRSIDRLTQRFSTRVPRNPRVLREVVCKTLQDPSVRLHEVDVSLFSPFRPMLAQRAVLGKVEAQMNHKVHLAETKFDGERSQIHKKDGDYKYFSRNGFDFTSNFGEDRHSGLFTPHLHPQLAGHVREVILDGEMVGWSRTHRTIVSKGELLDVKHLKEQGDWQVCFCAFDILYLNGKVLTNQPLSERLGVLRSVVTPLEGRVIISAYTKVKTREEVVGVLNEAIDNREEGVVLKDPDSVYQPAARRAGWIKVKPEYVDSLVPELDLVILGGFYGKGSNHGALSHFLLGVAVPPEEPGGRPRFFHSFSRVGSGYTVDELQDLVEKLKPHIRTRQPPSVVAGRVKKPDVWIDPCKSFVVQQADRQTTRRTQDSGFQQTQDSGFQQTQDSGFQQTQDSGFQQTQGSGFQQTQDSGFQQTQDSGFQQTQDSGW
ncbi:DNA ligase 4 [Chionoecetes opilio]|uniref:DNA ligase (ATP) n=1 Tax=Chionoecetes opilio TaxID=41210 RepID=A0A8J5D0D4_CHIOP|nr:DNA ligase 4 [Chionoecetes opilio]